MTNNKNKDLFFNITNQVFQLSSMYACIMSSSGCFIFLNNKEKPVYCYLTRAADADYCCKGIPKYWETDERSYKDMIVKDRFPELVKILEENDFINIDNFCYIKKSSLDYFEKNSGCIYFSSNKSMHSYETSPKYTKQLWQILNVKQVN